MILALFSRYVRPQVPLVIILQKGLNVKVIKNLRIFIYC